MAWLSSPKRSKLVSPLPSEATKAAFVQEMFDDISTKYDITNRIITLRMDLKWRNYAISTLGLATGSTILDVACGTGDFVRMLNAQSHKTIGVDFSLGMLRASQESNLIQADANKLPFSNNTFDGLTCGFAIRNFVDLDQVLREISRIVKIGARIAIVEVSRPSNPLLRSLHSIYFDRIMPVVGSIISSSNAYSYLSASTAYLPTEPILKQKLINAGFSNIQFKYFLFGSAQVISANKVDVDDASA